MDNKFDISSFVNVVTEQAMKKEIVKKFKLRRKKFGITQKDLAMRSGVSYVSIRRFESTENVSLYSLLII
jgi:predicted transcriptional regulator